MPTLYILCGLPFAGKTTLARQIVAARDIACVSLNQVKADEGYYMSDDAVPDADWAGIYDVVHASLLMPLRLGRDVLYDAANLTRKERDDLRDLAVARGFRVRVIHVAVPASVFDAAVVGFEEPSRDEDVMVYTPGQDVTKWIEANF